MAADGVSLDRLRGAVEARRAAPSQPVRIGNRLQMRVLDECARLADDEIGRQLLERASATDSDPDLRISAAMAVAKWDLPRATRVLEELVALSGAQVANPMTMTAALAVRQEPGRTAALCLLTLARDLGPTSEQEPPAGSAVSVSTAELDAAERVLSLAMNGGLDHAFDVAGVDFRSAAAAFAALGASAASVALEESVRLITSQREVPDDRRERSELLAVLTPQDLTRLQAFSSEFTSAPNLMSFLEQAQEGG